MDIDYSQFSEREKEVISLLLQGKSNKQIAFALQISQSTVEYHLKNIYNKLQVSSRTEAVLRLGKFRDRDAPSETADTTIELGGKSPRIDEKSISDQKISRNKLYRIGCGLLIVSLLTAVFIPFRNPALNAAATLLSSSQHLTATPQPTSTEWEDQIPYVLDPHTFHDGDPATEGGDLAGILLKMPYLKSLGITTVLLSRVLNPTDFRSVDPRLGTNEELARVIEAFHSTENGPQINVVIDLQLSVIGSDHPWVNNPDFLRLWNYEKPGENIGCHEPCEPMMRNGIAVDYDPFFDLPILDHTSEEVYQEVRDTIFWWVDSFAIAGIRYATAHYYHAAFWPRLMKDFQERYGETKPDFWNIAEVWPAADKTWQIAPKQFINATSSIGTIGMDSIYDYAMTQDMQSVFAEGIDPNCISFFTVCVRLFDRLLNPTNIENPQRITVPMDGLRPFLQVVTGNSKEKSKLALVFLMTINRVPLITSGNEYAIQIAEVNDLFALGLDQGYHGTFKQLAQIRRDNDAFRSGNLTLLDTPSNIISFARKAEGPTFLVVLNNSDTRSDSTEIDLESYGIPCSTVKNLFKENDQDIQLAGNTLSVTLDAWEPKIVQCD